MSYPYHSMLLPIEYYKTRGHFPTSCSHIQRVQKIQGTNCALKIISRSKSVLAHWPKSHLFKHLNKAVCDSKLQQGGLGETSSWLNFFLPWAIFFFCHFAIQVLCISHPPFAPTTVVIVVFFVHKILRSKCISTHPKDRQARVTLNYLGSSFRL